MDLQIEKAHLFALKILLNVSPKTPNDMVYGETGRTPLHLDAKVGSIRFWLRLMRMEAERLPRKAYNMPANSTKKRKTMLGIRCTREFDDVWVWIRVG